MSNGSTPVATDPLGAIRVELVGAARRRAAARRRRRRLLTVATTALVTLALAASAGALMVGSTGVSAIDDFLGKVDSSGQGSEGDRAESGGPVPSLVPATPSSASDPLEVTGAGLSGPTTLTAYVSSGGPICLVLLQPHGEGAGEAREGWGCVAPDALSRSLAGDSVLVADVRSGDATLVSGYTGDSVEAIDVNGPGGPFEVYLAERWTPAADGAASVRPFVAVGAAGSREAGRPGDYMVEERLRDGRTIEVRE